jgi:hypothetical protein
MEPSLRLSGFFRKEGRDCSCHCDPYPHVFRISSPVGIETRPQSNVSLIWLAYFVVVLIVEFTAIPMIYRRPSVGGELDILAAILNILFVLADQAYLLQPEVAPLSYSVLQSMTVIASLALAYFSWVVRQTA